MNIEAAKAEIRRTEAILRTRYHYAHPVFDHLTAALEHLGDDLPEAESAVEVPAEPEETVEQLKAEAEAAVVVEEEVEAAEGSESTAEPEPSATRAGRRS